MRIEIELNWCEDGSDKERWALHYANTLVDYHLGLNWMRPGSGPVGLTDKEKAKVRLAVYKALREQFPNRFKKGHRFA